MKSGQQHHPDTKKGGFRDEFPPLNYLFTCIVFHGIKINILTGGL